MSPDRRKVESQSAEVRKYLREAVNYSAEGNLPRAYAAAERAQFAAFDLKLMFVPESMPPDAQVVKPLKHQYEPSAQYGGSVCDNCGNTRDHPFHREI